MNGSNGSVRSFPVLRRNRLGPGGGFADLRMGRSRGNFSYRSSLTGLGNLPLGHNNIRGLGRHRAMACQGSSTEGLHLLRSLDDAVNLLLKMQILLAQLLILAME